MAGVAGFADVRRGVGSAGGVRCPEGGGLTVADRGVISTPMLAPRDAARPPAPYPPQPPGWPPTPRRSWKRAKAELERVSCGELLVAGQGGRQGEERAEQPGGALIAQGQPPVAGQPGEGAFDDPAVPAQPGAGLHPTAGDARGDAASAQPGPQVLVVVAGVGVQLGRTPPPRATA